MIHHTCTSSLSSRLMTLLSSRFATPQVSPFWINRKRLWAAKVVIWTNNHQSEKGVQEVNYIKCGSTRIFCTNVECRWPLVSELLDEGLESCPKICSYNIRPVARFSYSRTGLERLHPRDPPPHPLIGLHMGPNNLCYVARHFLFFPCVAMSLFIRP